MSDKSYSHTGGGYQGGGGAQVGYPPQPAYGSAYPPVSQPTHHEPAGGTGQPEQRLLKSEGDKFVAKSGCRDPLWSVLFVAHFIFVIVIAGVMYGKHKNEMSEDTKSSAVGLNSDTWSLFGILIAVGAAVSAFWLQMVKSFAHCLIVFTLSLSVIMLLVMSAMLFASKNAVMGGLFIFFALLNAVFIYMIRERIAFAATILSVVSSVLKNYSGTFAIALISVLFQAGWLVIWTLAASGSIYEVRNGSSETVQNVVYFFFLVSLYWTAQVISNIVHVTVAGTVASWYFLYPAHMPVNPTVGAFKRASWTSFGSIALGSFIVAVIKALRAMARAGKNAKHDCVRCMVQCILQCLDNLISYFNVYAFTQVAIYGKPYCDAARDTWSMLSRVGIDAILNDDLIHPVLGFASLIGGCMVGAIGGFTANFVFEINEWGYWVIIAFIIGFVMTMICMEVVSSGVCALFVCFSEDPAALQQSKPEVYTLFYTALTGHRNWGQVHLDRA